MYDGMRAFLKSGGSLEQLRKETGMDNIFEIMQYQWAISGDSPLAGHFKVYLKVLPLLLYCQCLL